MLQFTLLLLKTFFLKVAVNLTSEVCVLNSWCKNCVITKVCFGETEPH